jgi:hypothetical protein
VGGVWGREIHFLLMQMNEPDLDEAVKKITENHV